jgi:hypothetical protein
MAFKLIESAQDHWRMVNAPHLGALVRAGATFINGKLTERPADKQARSRLKILVSRREPTVPSTWPLSVTGHADHEKTRRLPARVCSTCTSITGTPLFITCSARVRSTEAASTPPSNPEGRRPMIASSGRPASRRNAVLVAWRAVRGR